MKSLKRTIVTLKMVREDPLFLVLLCLAQIPMLVLCSISAILMILSLLAPHMISMTWVNIPIALVDIILLGIILVVARSLPPAPVMLIEDDTHRG